MSLTMYSVVHMQECLEILFQEVHLQVHGLYAFSNPLGILFSPQKMLPLTLPENSHWFLPFSR